MAKSPLSWRGSIPALRVAVLAFAFLEFFPGFHQARAQTPIWPGRWTSPSDSGATLGYTPIHMALMPSDSTGFHSTLLMWNNSGTLNGGVSQLVGSVWLWRAVQDTFVPFPQSNFVVHPGSAMPVPGDVNIFCAGHAHRADGKLVVSGGTDHDIEVGITDNVLFDYSTLSWSALPSMDYRRWYPTINVLSDDRMFVNGGTQHVHAWMFGGKEPGASAPKTDLERFAIKRESFWDTTIPADQNWPSPRVGHAMAIHQRNTPMLVWGGRDSTGAYPTDLYTMYREGQPRGDDYFYKWLNYTPAPAPGQKRPGGRYDHTMVYSTIDEKMHIFGGRRIDGAYSTGFGDTVWHIVPRNGQNPAWGWEFDLPNTAQGDPGLRFGHAAIMDEDRKSNAHLWRRG